MKKSNKWVRITTVGMYAYKKWVSDRVSVVRIRAYELDGLWIVCVERDGLTLWKKDYEHLLKDPSNDNGYLHGKEAIAYGNELARVLKENLSEIEGLNTQPSKE